MSPETVLLLASTIGKIVEGGIEAIDALLKDVDVDTVEVEANLVDVRAELDVYKERMDALLLTPGEEE